MLDMLPDQYIDIDIDIDASVCGRPWRNREQSDQFIVATTCINLDVPVRPAPHGHHDSPCQRRSGTQLAHFAREHISLAKSAMNP